MGAYIYAFKMLKKNVKSNLIYLISIIFPMALIFNLLNVINNANFFADEVAGRKNDIAADIIFLLVLLVCVFTFYANSYFVMGKSKEMGIAELSGIWPGKMARMLLFQNTLIELVGCVLGILVGMAIMPVFLLVMYNIIGKSGSLFVISNYSIGGTFAILFLQLVYATMGDYSYASTREIIDLIEYNKRSRPKAKKYLSLKEIIDIVYMRKDKEKTRSKVKLFNKSIDLCLIGYFIPIIFPFLCPKYVPVSVGEIFAILPSIYGIQGIITHSIPKKILSLKNEKYLDDKIKMISLSNLYVSLKNLKFLLVTLAVTVEGVLCAMAVFESPRVKTICVFAYVTIIILISASILYKTIMEADKKNQIFNQLALIGYTTKEIKQIIKEEFKLYYAIIITLPLFHILIFFIMFKKANMLSSSMLIMMLLIFLIAFCLTGLICYRVYRKLVLKKNRFRFF